MSYNATRWTIHIFTSVPSRLVAIFPPEEWQPFLEEFNAFRDAFRVSLSADPEKKRLHDIYVARHNPGPPLIRFYRGVQLWRGYRHCQNLDEIIAHRKEKAERENLLKQQPEAAARLELEQRKRNAYLKQGITPQV